MSQNCNAVLGTLALVLAAMALGCSGEVREAAASGRVRSTPKVEVALAESGPLDRPIRVSGLTRSRQAQTLSFKVGGVLGAVLVEPGQKVKKGQPLALIDPSEVSASADQARTGSEKAERDLARATALAKEGALPKAVLDDAESAARAARAAVRVASFNEARTVLVAPTAGVVESRLVEPGEIVAPGRPVVAFLGDARGWVVDVALTDREAATLPSGQSVEVRFDAAPDTVVGARLGDVSRLGNPATGTFRAEVLLPETLPLTARSGLVAKIKIPRAEPATAVVPLGALVDGQGRRAAVFTVEGGVAHRHAVEVGVIADGRAALTSELPHGASIVVRGATKLADGVEVEVVSATVEASR